MKWEKRDLTPLGIIAGSGDFPVLTAKRAKEKNVKVVSVGFKGITSEELSRVADSHLWISLGELTHLLQFFKKEGVRSVILAGTVNHAYALSPLEKLKAMSDLRTMKMLLSLKEKKASQILEAIINEIEKEGIRVLPSFTYLESELIKPGVLTKRQPTPEELKDISLGYQTAKKLSDLDIGLSVCVSQGVIVAVEALEGTDECVKRAGKILQNKKRGSGFVVVKVARPKQDPRYDLPVIGPTTIETMSQAGGTTLAVEPGWTLLIDKEAALAKANKHKISLIGYAC